MKQAFLYILFVAQFATLALAQRAPRDHARVVVGAQANIKASASYQLRLYSENTSEVDPLASVLYSNQAGLSVGVYSAQNLFKLIPGQLYYFRVTSTSWTSADIQFNVPAGYTLRLGTVGIARSARTTIPIEAPSGGSGATIVELSIEPQDGAGMLAPGFSTVPSVGEVLWAIGLGKTSSGRSAGVVRWRANTISQDLLSPASLVYADPSDSDVSVERTQSGVLSSVTTWGLRLEIEPTTNGYTISARPPWDDSTVFRKYTISNPDSTWQNRVKILVESFDADQTRTDSWTLSKPSPTVTMIEQLNGVRRAKVVSSSGPGTYDRTEIITIDAGPNTAVVSRTKRIHHTFDQGTSLEREELVTEIAEPMNYFDEALNTFTDLAALNWTTDYSYYSDNSAQTGSYAKLKSVTRPDGSWEVYRYYGDLSSDAVDRSKWGQLAAIYRPWQDSTGISASNANDGNCKATLLDYTGERAVYREWPASEETRIDGVSTAKTTTDYSFWGGANSPALQQMRTETIKVYSSVSSFLTTVRTSFQGHATPLLAGRLYSQVNPDGTKIAVRYDLPSESNDLTEYRLTGLNSSVSGSTLYAPDGNWASLYLLGGKSTEKKAMIDAAGRVQWDVLSAAVGGYTTSSYNAGVFPIQSHTYSYNDKGELESEIDGLGRGASYTYVNGKVRVKSNGFDATVQTNNYDSLMRLSHTQVAGVGAGGGYAAQAAVDTNYSFDAAGRVLSTTQSAGGISLTTSATYNLAGLPTTSTDEKGLISTIIYADGGRTVTTKLPGTTGSEPTKIETRYKDGSPKSTTGTAVVGQYVVRDPSVGVSGVPDGSMVTTTYVLRAADGANPTAAPRWSRATADWAGKKFSEERPATSGIFTKKYFYNSLGQLSKTTEPDLADSLYSYDHLGHRWRSGLDLNQDGTLSPLSTDRIEEVHGPYSNGQTAPAEVFYSQTSSATFVYASDSSATAFLKSATWEGMYRDPANWLIDGPGSFARDAFGNDTTQSVIRVVSGGLQLVKTLANRPDSSTDEITISRNGVVQSKQDAQGLVSSYGYDALRRPVTEARPRTGTVKTAYYTRGAAGTYLVNT
jgi:hypothetical protein